MYACGLGRALLESGSAEEALSQATRYLERRPGHSGARALESLARMALGDTEGVKRLLDYQRFVSASKLATPEGFADLAAFNAALAAHVGSHRTLMSSPISHATKDGLHSGSLLVEPRGPVGALELAVGRLPPRTGAPFRKARRLRSASIARARSFSRCGAWCSNAEDIRLHISTPRLGFRVCITPSSRLRFATVKDLRGGWSSASPTAHFLRR